MNQDDRLREHLREMADQTVIADLTVEQVVNRADRRGVTHRGIAVAALVALIAGIGALGVGLNRNSGDGGFIVGENGPAADGGDVAVGEGDAEPDGTDSGIDSEVPPPIDGSEGTPTLESELGDGPRWLVPWQDGFLQVGTIYEPPPVPAAAEGDEIPGRGITRLVARISSDGQNWSAVSLGLPGVNNSILDIRSDGTHLLLIRETTDGDGARGIEVLSSTDLVDWVIVELPTEGVDDPALVQHSSVLSGVALSFDGWLVSVDTSRFVDVLDLLPVDVRSELDEDDELDWRMGPGGVSLQTWEAGADAPTVVRVIPWAELGIDYEVYGLYIEGGLPTRRIWHGSWDGTIAQATSPADVNCCRFVGTAGGFLAYPGGGFYFAGNTDGTEVPMMAFSTDGQSWSLRTIPDHWTSIDGIHAVQDGVVLRTAGPDGQELWRAEPDGSGLTGRIHFQRAELPVLPAPWIWFHNAGGRGVAGLLDVNDRESGDESDYPDTIVEDESDYADTIVEPDLWLIASADGEGWLVQDLDDDHEESYFPGALEVSGNTVALQHSGAWLTFDLG